jgi:hypothetical protein
MDQQVARLAYVANGGIWKISTAEMHRQTLGLLTNNLQKCWRSTYKFSSWLQVINSTYQLIFKINFPCYISNHLSSNGTIMKTWSRRVLSIQWALWIVLSLQKRRSSNKYVNQEHELDNISKLLDIILLLLQPFWRRLFFHFGIGISLKLSAQLYLHG